MADYRLTQSGDEVQSILNNAAMRAQLNEETERATGAENQLQQNINSNTQAIGTEETRAKGRENELQQLIQQVNASLINYYLKTETYSATQIDAMLAAIKQFRYQVVDVLPTPSAETMGIIYLVPSAHAVSGNIKDEYITLTRDEGSGIIYYFEQIGETAIDLSNYYTKAQTNAEISAAINAALAVYSTTAEMNTAIAQAIATAIANYYTKAQTDSLIANFITKSVNDLVNYYLKSETYTQAEVNALIAAVHQFTYQSVTTLPTASADTMNKIYLVPSTNPKTKNVKDEFITIATTDQGTTTYSWEQIGSTTVDLSGYSTTEQMNTAISNAINTALASYSTTSQMTAAITTALANYYTKTQVDNIANKKTDKLTMTGAGAAVEDDIMVIDENGNIKDGGKKISDLQLKVTDCAMLGGGFPTCTTAGGTAAKTVSISHFLLLPNCRISVLFQNAFTATNPTLSINSGAAIAIRHFGRAMEIGKVHANTILTMVYDGTYWQVVGIEGITGSTPSGAVDLALPSGLLWCEHNVGASSPYDDGLYFSWGNITGHTGTDGYDFGTSNDGPYASTPGAALTGNIPVGNDYDAARHNMGAPWRMPTQPEFKELYDNCDSEWTDEDGVAGRRFTSRINGNSIFFPASGYRSGTGLNNRGSNGYYWSASLYSQTYGYFLYFDSTGVYPAYYNHRFNGFSVRAVQ